MGLAQFFSKWSKNFIDCVVFFRESNAVNRVKIEQKLAKREGRNLKATSEKINESHSNRRFFERIGLNFEAIHAKI